MGGASRVLATSNASFACRLHQGLSVTAPARLQPSIDPYLYTQGRWLDRDEERRRARTLRFNFDALLNAAITCSPGARQVVHCEKREGGFNRVFMMHLDNGERLVARLPTRVAGPPGLITSSEVATLQFVKEKTQIPVPSVLSWSSEMSGNPVGAEYIIMSSMPGVPLRDVWSKMTASQHIRCIKSIAYSCKELCSLNFDGYGSLFLRSNSPRGAMPFDEKYSIGSLCAPHHWGCDALARPNERISDILGPWRDVHSYLSDLIARAARSASSAPSDLELLSIAGKAQRMIIEFGGLKGAADPTLMHPDLHTRNIFVDEEDPTTITGIIDWQAAAIEPAFAFAANTPDFAEEIEKLPYDEAVESDDDLSELRPEAKLQADVHFCVKTWDLMQQLFPKYSEAFAIDPLLINLLAAGSTSWLKDPVSLRLLLTHLSERWQELELPGQSLYQPSGAEAERFEEQLDRARTTQQLKVHLSRLLRCDTDGWVPQERWEEVLSKYRAEYRRYIASLEVEGKSDSEKAVVIEDANDLWPYDQR